jgi:hypothetical protein
MAKHSGQTQRNLFPSHGAGKGDKDRTSDTTALRQGLDEIDWHRDQPDGFERLGHRLVKRYGPREELVFENGPHIKIL